MSKQLNPELFGDKKTVSAPAGADSGGLLSALPQSYLNTDRQIFELKAQNQALIEQVNKITFTLNEFMKTTNAKLDRQHHNLAKLDQSSLGLNSDTAQKLNLLSSKLAERKNFELKVQEMVDRHNSVIKSFEVRMNQLQMLLAEKESQMNLAQAALNETRMEIARLKRL